MNSIAKQLVAGIAVSSALLLVGCDKKADLGSDKGKYSYTLGIQIGRNFKAQNVELDYASFTAGIKDSMEGSKAQMGDDQMREAMMKAASSRQDKMTKTAQDNKQSGEKFLATNKAKEGVKVTASGLQYKVVKGGSGPSPKKDDTVKVHYKGTLTDGTEFDSSYKRDQPAEFTVSGVIPGWTEALQLMNVGSKYELVIPSELAYGMNGNDRIPPGSVLVFEVELLAITPAGAGSAHGAHEARPEAKPAAKPVKKKK